MDRNSATRLIRQVAAGDRTAADDLLKKLYDELHVIAERYMRRERPGHTLQATVLLDEAFMRLIGHEQIEWAGKEHFLSLAAVTMRRILVSHARKKRAEKRGGGGARVSLHEHVGAQKPVDFDLIALDEALNRLEQERFVASESFRGFYVRPMDIQEAWDAFGVREALETYAIEQAIIQGDEKGMTELEEKLRAHEEYKTRVYDQKKFLLDAEFHIQIARMSKNNVLRWLLKSNLEHVYLRSRLERLDPSRMSVAVKTHYKLVDTMKKKDIMGSIEIIKHHIHGSRDLIIKCLSNNALDEEDYYNL